MIDGSLNLKVYSTFCSNVTVMHDKKLKNTVGLVETY